LLAKMRLTLTLRSSLFLEDISDEEKKGFIRQTPGSLIILFDVSTLHYLFTSQKKNLTLGSNVDQLFGRVIDALTSVS
jgi:hypothetical protein